MLTDHQIIAEFEAAEAILRGHFILSSGLHSDTYLQCARVLMNPKRAEKLCAALAEKVLMQLGATNAVVPPPIGGRLGGGLACAEAGDHDSTTTQVVSLPQPSPSRGASIDLVVAPAMGGVVVGYEMGRQLGLETIFCEREAGEFTLRRGFSITPGARVLMVEDVVTTGKSSMEAVACVEKHGGIVVAEASLIDRSNGTHALPFPLVSLLTLDVKTYPADHLPAHLEGTEAVKPGSRFLVK